MLVYKDQWGWSDIFIKCKRKKINKLPIYAGVNHSQGYDTIVNHDSCVRSVAPEALWSRDLTQTTNQRRASTPISVCRLFIAIKVFRRAWEAHQHSHMNKASQSNMKITLKDTIAVISFGRIFGVLEYIPKAEEREEEGSTQYFSGEKNLRAFPALPPRVGWGRRLSHRVH